MLSVETLNRDDRTFSVSPSCTSYVTGVCETGADFGIATGLTILLTRPSWTLPTWPPWPMINPSGLTAPSRRLRPPGSPRSSDAYPDSASASSSTTPWTQYRLTATNRLPPEDCQRMDAIQASGEANSPPRGLSNLSIQLDMSSKRRPRIGESCGTVDCR